MSKTYFVYILSSKTRSTLYVGVTGNLSRRVQQHREGAVKGFTKRYRVHYLVYYEEHQRIDEAIAREKQIEKWRRAWKDELIESVNPKWLDLAEGRLYARGQDSRCRGNDRGASSEN